MLLVVMLLGTQTAWSQSTKISGYMFGDYYYVAANHNQDLEDSNGFWFRRIYLTFDQKVAEHWSVRLRGEMNQAGDFVTKAKLTPSVKDAYLKWSNGRHQVILGISPTPTWERLEKMWGYRAVEKTALDLYKMGSSRDFGLAAKGPLDAAGKVHYHVMLANGGGTSSEVNQGKKAMASLAVSPVPELTLEAYADFEARPGRADVYTVQGALFYVSDAGRLGVQFAHQNQQVEGGGDRSLDVLSLFGSVQAGKAVRLFGRFDRQFQPNPKGEKVAYLPFAQTAEANFVVAGLDYAVNEKIHFMPNVETIFYANAAGATPDTDVIPRFTFFYKF